MGHAHLYAKQPQPFSLGETLGRELAQAMMSLETRYKLLKESERDRGFLKIEALEKKIGILPDAERERAVETFERIAKTKQGTE